MQLNQLTVGPIVGETTQNRVRIWGRGAAQVIDDQPRRCFGAIRHRKQGAQSWSRTQIIKMNPNFDLTGLAILDRLQPETRYEYQMGFFFSEGELGDVKFGNSDWKDVSDGHF
jgi:alkaline phosphatase D